MNRKLFSNVVSLFSVQVFGYVIPLVTLPYIARALGPREWGLIAFAEAYANTLSIVVDYGFGLSASRDVAMVGRNVEAKSKLVAGVFGAQILLLLISLAITWFLSGTVSTLVPHGRLLAFAVVIAMSRSLTPVWYFLGTENLRLVSLLNIVAAAGAAGAIFSLVHSPADAWLVLAARGISNCCVTVVAITLLYREAPFIRPSVQAGWAALVEGFSMFVFKSATSFYTTANVLLLGLLGTPYVVGWFAGSEKIIRAALSTTTMAISQAFYPRIASLAEVNRGEASRALMWSARLMIGLGIVVGSVVFFGAPFIVKVLLGPGFERSIPVLKVMSALPVLIGSSNLLGVQWMLPLRLDREFNTIVIVAGLINIVLAVALVPRYHEVGMAFSVVATEAFIPVVMSVFLRSRGQQPWALTGAATRIALSEEPVP
jgi:polysaccharide transporter, PST family